VPAKVVNHFNDTQLNYILSSPKGAVAKDLLKRGKRVETRAKLNLSGATGSGPRRIDTGKLRASIGVELIVGFKSMAVRVGTNVYYARWVHDGTGLYGPHHMLILPKTAKVLRFKSRIASGKGKKRGWVYAKSVKGMRSNPFLAKALPAFHN
jgi:hypothetical protein